MRPTLRKTASLILLCVIACCSGCAGTRTVYIKDGNPVRIRKTIPQTEVWVQDGTGVWIEGKCDLPEGWYALPDPGKNK